MAIEETLIFIKPDGVKRKLIGEIINIFEKKGYTIKELKMLIIDSDLADKHYEEHIKKEFYTRLKNYITSGPVVAMIIKGENAIANVRKIVGATDGSEAELGSIRGTYAQDKSENIIHASDSLESAKREIKLYFN